MPKATIRFKWGEKTYELPVEAYGDGEVITVVLSATEAVNILSWKEKSPPEPYQIEVYSLDHLTYKTPSAAALKQIIGADWIATEVQGEEEQENGEAALRRHKNPRHRDFRRLKR